MADNQLNLGSERIFANNANLSPLYPPINPYDNPNFNNNPNPSFHNSPNQSFNNNPNPSFVNQGYANNNQGFNNPNRGNQGFNNNPDYNLRPYVIALPPPPPPARGVMCPLCRQETGSIIRKKAGNVTWIWCLVLLILTGCCCIPFFVDSCKDTELVCEVCQTPKSTIPANCC